MRATRLPPKKTYSEVVAPLAFDSASASALDPAQQLACFLILTKFFAQTSISYSGGAPHLPGFGQMWAQDVGRACRAGGFSQHPAGGV
jgi:hypothetical protein